MAHRVLDADGGNEENFVAILRQPPLKGGIGAVSVRDERPVFVEGVALDREAAAGHLGDLAGFAARQPQVELAEVVGPRDEALGAAVDDGAADR